MTSLASLPIGSLKWTCRLKEATDNAAYRSIFRSRPGGQAAICSAMGFVLARDPEGAEGGKCFRGNLDRRNLARFRGVCRRCGSTSQRLPDQVDYTTLARFSVLIRWCRMLSETVRRPEAAYKPLR